MRPSPRFDFMKTYLLLGILLVAATAPGQAEPETTAPVPTSAETELARTLRDIHILIAQKKYDEALTQIEPVIKANPGNPIAYSLRGGIYSEKELWADATKDFQKILILEPDNPSAKFNLAEVFFRQKKYDEARPGFDALTKNPVLGDLATYKVFLCDLLGGHEEVAKKEWTALNDAGTNASYYFGNVAWYLYHGQTADAREWLASAARIYTSQKIVLYSTSLMQLGYLPLPPL